MREAPFVTKGIMRTANAVVNFMNLFPITSYNILPFKAIFENR
jgi:hypothetical protein